MIEMSIKPPHLVSIRNGGELGIRCDQRTILPDIRDDI
jgi:hypothetical protein